jgi:hypothetical protein
MNQERIGCYFPRTFFVRFLLREGAFLSAIWLFFSSTTSPSLCFNLCFPCARIYCTRRAHSSPRSIFPIIAVYDPQRVNRTKVKVWVLESPFPSHSRLVFLLPLSCKVSQSHRLSTDISSQVGSWLALLFLQFHGLTTTVERSIAAFSHNKLCATFLTNISLPNLIRHLINLLRKNQWSMTNFQ